MGRTPKIAKPLASPLCASAELQSDSVISALLPDATAYGTTCPNLFACWNLRDRSTDDSPGSGVGVSGFGFRISGYGMRGSGFGVRGSGFGLSRASGFELYRVSGYGLRVTGDKKRGDT
jgi:hypothetical protein